MFCFRFQILVGYDGKLSADETMIACSWLERSGVAKIQVLNLQTKHIIASIPTDKAFPFALTSDNRHFVFCDTQWVRVCEMDGGEPVKEFKYYKGEFDKVTVRCITLSHSNHLVAICAKFGRPSNLHKRFAQWKAEARLFIVDLDKQCTIADDALHARKMLEDMFFICNDEKILAIGKKQISILNAVTLERLEDIQTDEELYCNLAQVLPDCSTVAYPYKVGNSIQLMLLNYQTGQRKHSDNLHMTDEAKLTAFGIHGREDCSMFVVGTTTGPQATSSCLCVWDIHHNTYSRIKLQPQQYKCPNVMSVTKSWKHAFVGWTSGHLTLVNLEQQVELFTIQSHGQAINFIVLLSDGSTAITLAQDHSLKMWDVNRSIELADQKHHKLRLQRSDAIWESPTLNPSEQCIDMSATAKFAISAPQNSTQGPQLWNLLTGQLEEQETEFLHTLYDSSCQAKQIEFDQHTHAGIKALEQDMLMYNRKTRNGLSVFMTQGYSPIQVCGHKHFCDTYFHLTPPGGILRLPDGTMDLSHRLILVKDSSVEVYTLPGLDYDYKIDITSISKDVKNVSSSAGKRRLFQYRIGLTYDGRYFVIVNPGGSFGARELKYFDMIDMQERKYKSRVTMSKYVPMTLLSDSVTFLVETEDGSAAIYQPSKLCQLDSSHLTYSCPIYTGRFVSCDGKLGVESLHRDHTINLWQLHPLQKLHSFSGHLHQVSSFDISCDNRYLVTGSYDKTVRVWSVTDGRQLCMFHVNGSVDKVLFNPTDQYIIVNSYSAPQKKRGIILKLQNVKNRRKFGRYMSRYDIM